MIYLSVCIQGLVVMIYLSVCTQGLVVMIYLSVCTQGLVVMIYLSVCTQGLVVMICLSVCTQGFVVMVYLSVGRTEKSTDQVIKPVNVEALSKWVGNIPEDVVKDMHQIAPMLMTLGYDPHANPPNYGKPDPQVADNTLHIKTNADFWQQKEKDIFDQLGGRLDLQSAHRQAEVRKAGPEKGVAKELAGANQTLRRR